ncbi:MAG: TolA-binding protein [Halieaceae bacterium]|jgi:TolA-binding protein
MTVETRLMIKSFKIASAALRVTALSIPLLALQIAITQVQIEMEVSSPLGVAVAQQTSEEKRAAKKKADAQQTRKTPALNNKVYEKLSEAQVFAEDKNYAGALGVLDEMRDKTGKKALNSYELANLYNLYAFIYYSKEDYKNALASYENVVKQENIPLAMEVNTRYTIAQLYFVQEDWKRGIAALHEWFELADNPSAQAYVLLGQGYFQLKDYVPALNNIETAVRMYKENDKVPKEQWYSLLRYLHYEQGNINTVVEILNELLVYYPKKQYWVLLSHMYAEIKQEDKQLAAMEVAYAQGMLDKQSELINMTYIYMGSEVPYKAALVLSKAIKGELVEQTSKNLEILGSAWRQAQEIKKSLPVMEAAAAKSDKGELYARLCSIYVDTDAFQKAIDACNKGLKMGQVKRPDNTNLLLGMANFNVKKYSSARKAFKEARKDKRSKKFADSWIKYMDSELDRQRKMAEDF